MSIIDTLITDRTRSGHYDITDLNRVGEAMYFVAERLRTFGYDVVVSPKIDWVWTDHITHLSAMRLLDDLQKIKGALTVFKSTPKVPNGERPFDSQEANDIEQILLDVDKLLNIMATTFIPCGEALCGEDNL